MARTWLQIKVELLGGGGIRCKPAPGRIFVVGPGHTFEQLAEAINAAFARWDLGHLHSFELADERLIGYPDDTYAPDVVWLDHAKLKVTREVKPVQSVVAFVAGAQASQVVQPRERALHDPPLAPEMRAVLDAAAGNHGLDAARPQLAPVLVVVIATVGQDAIGALARPADLARDRADRVDQRQQLGDVVAVAAGQRDRQRNPVAVGQQVVLGAGAGPVNWRGPGLGPLEEHVDGCHRPHPSTSRSGPRRSGVAAAPGAGARTPRRSATAQVADGRSPASSRTRAAGAARRSR
jgi:hypothetical protein